MPGRGLCRPAGVRHLTPGRHRQVGARAGEEALDLVQRCPESWEGARAAAGHAAPAAKWAIHREAISPEGWGAGRCPPLSPFLSPSPLRMGASGDDESGPKSLETLGPVSQEKS
jgi:hypothetical protein